MLRGIMFPLVRLLVGVALCGGGGAARALEVSTLMRLYCVTAAPKFNAVYPQCSLSPERRQGDALGVLDALVSVAFHIPHLWHSIALIN